MRYHFVVMIAFFRPVFVLLVAIATLTVSSPASAERRFFINGVDLTDTEIVGQSFANCAVRFDEKGDVHIVAKGFKVAKQPVGRKPGARAKTRAKTRTEPPPAPRNRAVRKLTRRYFLTSHESQRGATQYDIQVRINDRRVTTIRSNAARAAIDITSFVRPGKNAVQLLATKRKHDPRRSSSANHKLVITVGEGRISDGTVTVTRALFDYTRSAAETASFNNVRHFTGR